MTLITDKKASSLLDDHRSFVVVDTLSAFFWLLANKPTGCDVDWENFDASVFSEITGNTRSDFISSNDAGHLLDAVASKIDGDLISDVTIIEYVAEGITIAADKALKKAEGMSSTINLANRLAAACQELLQECFEVSDMVIDITPANGERNSFAHTDGFTLYNFELNYLGEAAKLFKVRSPHGLECVKTGFDCVRSSSTVSPNSVSKTTSEFISRLVSRSTEAYAVAHCVWLERPQGFAPGSGKTVYLNNMIADSI